jgi:hypothetical protein
MMNKKEREHNREIHKRFMANHPGINKVYYDRWRKKHREQYNAIRRAYYHLAKNRHKMKVRWMTYNAILAGEIKREKCSVCGADYAQAHHPDYRSWRKIVWLCRSCHTKHHLKTKLNI